MAVTQTARAAWERMISGTRFSTILKKVKLITASEGKCVAEMTVGEEHSNDFGTLHGAMTATLVDNVSTLALVTSKREAYGVSVDMHLTYMKGAAIGEDIVITANTQRAGKTLAFLDVLITKKNGGDIVAKGSHTKYVG